MFVYTVNLREVKTFFLNWDLARAEFWSPNYVNMDLLEGFILEIYRNEVIIPRWLVGRMIYVWAEITRLTTWQYNFGKFDRSEETGYDTQ